MQSSETHDIVKLVDDQKERLTRMEISLDEIAKNLQPLDVLSDIHEELRLLRTELVAAATERIPVKILEAVGRSHMMTVRVLLAVVAGLIVWATGIKMPGLFTGV